MNIREFRAGAAVFGVGLLAAGCAQFGWGDGNDGSGGASAGRMVPTVLLVDSSGSMAQDDAPGPRIDAAKKASTALMTALPDGTPTSLVTYGANTDDRPESQAASCEDITVLRPLAPLAGADSAAGDSEVDAAVDGLAPGGFTPIGRALEVAATELEGAETGGEKAIILISDGEDTCGDPTPCEAARSIKQAQPDVVISTIGFKSDVEELACVARETGGLYLTADNVDQLVSRVVAAQNASADEAVLTPTGRSGIELGQHFDDIRSAHADFPGQDAGVSEDDLTVIRWMDCDWVFDSTGRLVEIRDDAAATIDGLAVGSAVARARELYGEPVDTVSRSDDQLVELFPASKEAGTAWKIASDKEGTIRSVILCGCLPDSSGARVRFAPLPDGVPEWARKPGGPEVEILRPVDSQGVVQPGWDVEAGGGQCRQSLGGSDSSYAAVEDGLVVCDSTTASSASNCWPDATGLNALCLRDPFGRTLIAFTSRFVLTGQPPTSNPVVIGVELANGEHCVLMAGGSGTVIEDGGRFYNSRFICSNGAGYAPDGDSDETVLNYFEPQGPKLIVKYSTDYKTATDVEVTKLIFLGTA